jgi:Kef-type K+ transport system membrane component KefB
MEFVVLAIAVAAFLAVGFGLGMLVAPRIGRWADRDDEEPHDDGPG